MPEMRTEKEVLNAMEIVLKAIMGSEEGSLDHRGNAAMALTLAWVIGEPKEPAELFQRMLETCRSHDKPLRHGHRSGRKRDA